VLLLGRLLPALALPQPLLAVLLLGPATLLGLQVLLLQQSGLWAPQTLPAAAAGGGAVGCWA
jgi:hypothetical protein